MAQTTIKKKKLYDIINILLILDYTVKNIFNIRAEKLLKKLYELSAEINEEIADIQRQWATKDEKGNFVCEALTETEKNGKSKTQNAGNFKYTKENADKRDAAIENLLNTDITIPTYIVSRSENMPLYKEIFKKYSPTTISVLAGILLDVPIDEEEFVTEEFVLEMTSEPKTEANGKHKEATLASD